MLITFGSKRLINICHCLQLTPESSFLFGIGLSLLFSKFQIFLFLFIVYNLPLNHPFYLE